MRPKNPADDPYVAYLHRFFAKWSPVYDLFAAPIGFAYRAAVSAAGAAPGRSLLDLCTGTGEIAGRAARAGATVTAVDLTPGMLERARQKVGRLGVRLELADARALPFAAGSFDAVILSFALHDMPRPVRLQVLAEAMRVARDKVVVLDYAFPGPGARLAVAARLVRDRYLRGFAARSRIVAEAGFAARACTPVAAPFALWDRFRRRLRSAGPRRCGRPESARSAACAWRARCRA
jgi:demethylmenaquinone methyltransferase/2-methoxy-6-polyprenyl-1,4-benzoquinol methylase